RRAGGVLVLGTVGFGSAADVDQLDRLLADLVNQETVAGAEVAVEVLAAISGDRDPDRAGHFAVGIGVDRGKVAVLEALAPQQADGFLQGFGIDADVTALFGEVAG